MNMAELETALRSLLKGDFSSLSLTFNDQPGPNYQTVGQWDAEQDESSRSGEWVSEDERRKAIETNSVWSLHWYPHTPIGFYELSASSLESVIKAALEEDV